MRYEWNTVGPNYYVQSFFFNLVKMEIISCKTSDGAALHSFSNTLLLMGRKQADP